jgi:hypothetical protein
MEIVAHPPILHARLAMFRTAILPVLLLSLASLTGGAQADDPALRTLTSKHLTLVTDLPPDPEVDALPSYFDQAFPQWCAYFGVDPAKHQDWHPRGFLMQSRERFEAAGLISNDVPEFATGYALGGNFWLFDQTSPYYRRHLMFHEGTHAFVMTAFGSTGPAWYSEGAAELLGTHRLEGGKLVLNVVPADRNEVPKWGRIEAVQGDFAQRKALTIEKVFGLGGTLHGTVEQYGWCWAAAAFFEHHPQYRARFHELARQVNQADFQERAVAAFAADRRTLDEDWQIFIANLDYGFDFERMHVERQSGMPLGAVAAHVSVAANRGWQSSGIAVEAGKKYSLRASGRYQIAGGEQPWQSEPAGVTIEYYAGRPLGMLLAAVRTDDDAASARYSGLIQPIAVGGEATLEPKQSGTLYFRINDSAGRLADNRGAAEVEVSAAN